MYILAIESSCDETSVSIIKDGCEDKTNCVRVIYQSDYHVDIPIYIMDNDHALLANKKTNKWVEKIQNVPLATIFRKA